MSIAVMNWMWANSPTSGNERLVRPGYAAEAPPARPGYIHEVRADTYRFAGRICR